MTISWLPADLPKRLRDAGCKVVELDGWHTRGRPASKGPFHPVGVLWHHTGSTEGGPKYANWLAKIGRSDLPAPLCHLSIGRDGTVYVVAAGRANHAGVAKASGSVAGGDGNALYVGVECQNSGSEGWRPAQRAAMVRTGVVLAHVLGSTAEAQRGHKETSVTGKWDPGKFDMDAFRKDIAAQLVAKPVESTPAKPKPVANHVTEGWDLVRQGIAELRQAPKTRKAIHSRAEELAAVVKKGPSK
jgi:hypothetical protein